MNKINEYKSNYNMYNNINKIKDKKINELKEKYEKYINKAFEIFKIILNKINSIHSLLNLKNNSKLNDLINKYPLNFEYLELDDISNVIEKEFEQIKNFILKNYKKENKNNSSFLDMNAINNIDNKIILKL